MRLLAIFSAVCAVVLAVVIWRVLVLTQAPAASEPPTPPPPAVQAVEATPPEVAEPEVRPSPPPATASTPTMPPLETEPGTRPAKRVSSTRWVNPSLNEPALRRLAEAREVLAHDPLHPRALADELSALRELQRWPEAADTLQRLLSLDPDDTRRRRELAEVLLRLGRWPEAIEALDIVVEREPGDADAWQYLAAAHQSLGHLQDALLSWNTVIELQPDNADAYAYRGAALLRFRDWEGALADFERAGQLNPADAGVALNRSLALSQLGRTEEAERCLHDILANQPSNVPAMNRLAELAWQAYRSDPHANADKRAEAIQWWRQSLSVDPEQPDIAALAESAERELPGRYP